MRNLETGIVDDLLTRQNQIQIERTRSTLMRPRAPGSCLDRTQRLEQLAGRQRRLPHAHRIQIRRIVFEAGAHRRCFDDRGKVEGVQNPGHLRRGIEDLPPPVSKIAAEGDDDRPWLVARRLCALGVGS